MAQLRLLLTCFFFFVLAAVPTFGQSFQRGSIAISTGIDDFRSNSNAWVEFLRSDEVLDRVALNAQDEKFADGTTKTVLFQLTRPLAVSDIEFIRLVYHPDRNDVTLNVDEWRPTRLLIRVTDGTPSGTRTLFDGRRLPHLKRDRNTWTSATLPTFGRTQTRVVFKIATGNDDLRDDSMTVAEVETDDGRVFYDVVYGRLNDRTTKTVNVDLPPGTTSNNIRFARVSFGHGVPVAFKSIPTVLWLGDRWEVEDFTATAIEPDGRSALLANSGRVKFDNPGWWTSPPLRVQRLPYPGSSSAGSMPTSFVIFIYTGNDDLRTDPAVQPNSELEITINLRDGRSVPLDTGRRTRANFVGTSDTAFFGSFKDWGTAWAVATAAEDIPFANIESFSISMIRGRGQRGVITGGTPDAVRGNDEWVLNGFWIGVSPASGLAGDPAHAGNLYTQALRLFSQYNINAKLNQGNRTFTSERMNLPRERKPVIVVPARPRR